MAGRLVTFLALATVLVLAPAANAAVVDTNAPTGAVGGVRSQASGVLTLTVLAVDDGLGLSRAAAALDGVALADAPFGDGTCVEAPDEAAGTGCPAVSTATLDVPTAGFADGPHELTVTVRDAALNVATLVRQSVTVANTPPKDTSTVTVSVGSGKIRAPSGSGPGGGPVGPQEGSCTSPRLEIFLASRPLRIRKGLPVLAAGHKYRWRGKLTCRIDGKRRPAPRGTVVQLRSIIGGRIVSTRKLKVGRRGKLSVRLALRSSRVLVFRFAAADGDVVRVRMRVRVVRLRPRRAGAAAAAGGLSITPAILEQRARRGAADTVEIVNSSDRKLNVTVAARPWRQSRTGTVAADRRRNLSRFVRVSDSSFTLAGGARRTITVTLARVPAKDSLYGSLEVIGRPTRPRKGVNVGYRLIGSLRFNPRAADRKLKLRAGAARVSGRKGNRSLTLQVSNAGNTIDPVGGDVVIRGPRGGRSSGISAVKILPGKRVSLELASLDGLRGGRYTAAVTLKQRGRNRLSVSRHFHIPGS
ncbi:MAG TPA: hypothetical protein VFX51_06270 [Solirubrobacteraceae bacterium]|nr:hypothetical protein [Solirubrobacteraceae bacterium]